MRFVLYGQDYGDGSCGVRVLHRLCHWLNELGHDASLGNTWRLHPEWNVKRWDCTMTPETIVIYPEFMWGNAYDAKRVVRWALYYPGDNANARPPGPSQFGAGDKVFYYADAYAASARAASADGTAERLFVSAFESDLFYPSEEPRTRDGFYVGRGVDVEKEHRGIIGSEMYEFYGPYETRADLAAELRKTKRFYSFDPMSGWIPEAMLAGCETFIVAKDGIVHQVVKESPETLGVFEDLASYDHPRDILRFLEMMQTWEMPTAP